MKNQKKIIILIFLFFFFCVFLGAEEQKNSEKQNENEITFDNLQTPDSPGFILLGISPTSINRPGTSTDLAFTILSNTNYLSTIPKNFSVEFSPYWIFLGKGLSYESFREDNNPLKNLLHTLSLSVATNTVAENEIENTSLGFGIRFSLFKGKQTDIDDLFTNSKKNILDELSELFEYKYLPKINLVNDENITSNEKTEKTKNIYIEYNKEANNLYSKWLNTNNIRFYFYGFKWDVAGGFVIDFPDRDFDQGKFGKWGIWTTLGYEKNRISGLFVGRILKNKIEDKKASIDFGTRLIYDSHKKVALSGELLARLNSEDVESKKTQWRYVANLEYIVGKNQKLTFSIGRDFKGTSTGNLIAMINFIFGTGSTRPVPAVPTAQ